VVKLLVAGAEGQVAKCLVEAGVASGVDVTVLGRPRLDIKAPASIADAVKSLHPDVVVNAAAYTAVDKAESELGIAHDVNALGAGNVARAAHEAGVPVIHISTDYVFDGCKASAYTESDPVGPTSVYGQSKLEGERLVAAVAPRHVIVRTAWVHSPFGHNFVKTMLKLARARPEIGVVDDQHGSPTYAPHLAAAILDVARQVNGLGDASDVWGVYHACGTGETTWCGLAREVFSVSARMGGQFAQVNPVATADYPTAARRPANSRLSCEKLRTVFGVSLPDWRVGVSDCVERLVTGH
jgi:dTDP-4-dehydrorhamnose reductase